ncbi:MAG: carbon-nitrogen hydrolase family protein [Leisingera sp.]
MTASLNIAVAQSPADLAGPQARLTWLQDRLSRLEGRQTDLLLLPELFLTGYNIGSRVSEWAEPVNGPSAAAIAELARAYQVAIHYGFAEQKDGSLFNSASCIGKDGELLATHRKLLLPPGFEGDHFSPGGCYTLFELGGFKVATLICYDAEFPETFREVAQAGAELVLVPTALGAQWGVVAHTVIPARAFENGVFVCYANSCGHENGMDYFGGSCVIAPNGQELARAGEDEEMLCVQARKASVAAAQARLPYLADRLKLPGVPG